LVGLLVAYQQLGFDAVVLERFHETAGGDGCAADALGCIDK